MKFLKETRAFTGAGSVVTIGAYDAIHRGHREIITTCVRVAQEMDLPSVVLTFDRNPRQVVCGQAPCLITPRQGKIELIDGLYVDYLIVVEFNREFASMEPARFCVSVLGGDLRARAVCVGENFHFGAGGSGDVRVLEEEGKEVGFSLRVVPMVMTQQGPLSSTMIRNLISEGRMKEVGFGLGRPYVMVGRVIAGHSRGKSLGFPTANLRMESNYCMPDDGVYAGKALIGGSMYASAINVGNNPTFGDEETVVEVFLLDFEGEIYGESMSVEFHDRLRNEVAFVSDSELIAQIEKDVSEVRALIGRV